jgi:hypothetical protein
LSPTTDDYKICNLFSKCCNYKLTSASAATSKITAASAAEKPKQQQHEYKEE